MKLDNLKKIDGATVNAIASLKSNYGDGISAMFKAFGNKPFLRYHAQGVSQHPLVLAYKPEEEAFLENVKLVHITDIPQTDNSISSQVIYKVKGSDDNSLSIKARKTHIVMKTATRM